MRLCSRVLESAGGFRHSTNPQGLLPGENPALHNIAPPLVRLGADAPAARTRRWRRPDRGAMISGLISTWRNRPPATRTRHSGTVRGMSRRTHLRTRARRQRSAQTLRLATDDQAEERFSRPRRLKARISSLTQPFRGLRRARITIWQAERCSASLIAALKSVAAGYECPVLARLRASSPVSAATVAAALISGMPPAGSKSISPDAKANRPQ